MKMFMLLTGAILLSGCVLEQPPAQRDPAYIEGYWDGYHEAANSCRKWVTEHPSSKVGIADCRDIVYGGL